MQRVLLLPPRSSVASRRAADAAFASVAGAAGELPPEPARARPRLRAGGAARADAFALPAARALPAERLRALRAAVAACSETDAARALAEAGAPLAWAAAEDVEAARIGGGARPAVVSFEDGSSGRAGSWASRARARIEAKLDALRTDLAPRRGGKR
jgi:hypothetical protein